MINPSNEVTYWIDFKTDKIVENDEEGQWDITIYDKDIRVGAFSTSGGWKAKITCYSNLWIIENHCGYFTLLYNVGESSWLDHLTAPLHLTWGGIPLVGWGKSSFALPSILLIASPFLIIGLFIIALRFWFGSFRLGLRELRKAPVKLFRGKKKKGGKKNVKAKKI